MSRDLEKQLVVGAQVKIGKAYSELHGSFIAGQVITLIQGEFKVDDDYGGYYEYAPSIWDSWDSNQGEFYSIYHLFENDLSGFMDNEVVGNIHEDGEA